MWVLRRGSAILVAGAGNGEVARCDGGDISWQAQYFVRVRHVDAERFERCQKPSGTFIKIIKTFRQSLRNPFAAACFAFADLLHPKTSFANPFAEFLLLAPKLIK